MFDQLIKELRKMHGTINIPTTIEIDDKGYLDRSCPSDECRESFKINFEDWKHLAANSTTTCPRCGHCEDAAGWSTPEQREQHINEARNHIQARIGNAMKRDARSFNSRQKSGGFISVRMSYRPGRPELVLPAKSSEVMTQEFHCENCACRYASIGAAFFCPACGIESILENLWTSLETTRQIVDKMPELRQTMEHLSGQDVAADMSRQLLEEALCKVVSCFQKYAEVRFSKLDNASDYQLRTNLFQSLAESDRYWRAATSKGYTDILSHTEYPRLITYFQQRHVLEHQDGFIDEAYVSRSQDTQFGVGRRLVVAESSVLDLIAIVEKLAQGIDSI